MICSKCGSVINDGDNFCEECGASIKQNVSQDNTAIIDFPKSKSEVCNSDLAAVTNIGRKHPTNEDAGTVFKSENGDVVLIVADGVSSSLSATSASQKTIDIIKESLVKNDASTKEKITAAIHSADACVKDLPYITKEDGIYGPETTVVAAIVQNGVGTLGWVGDSRAYIINKDKQLQLTIDDSWVELVVAEGSMTREEALLDRRAHYVTQVLGMHDQEANVHLKEFSLEKGDMLLLCSDGLWNYFQGEDALLNAMKAFGINSDSVNICEYLVGLANAAGGRDNITAALYRNVE